MFKKLMKTETKENPITTTWTRATEFLTVEHRFDDNLHSDILLDYIACILAEPHQQIRTKVVRMPQFPFTATPHDCDKFLYEVEYELGCRYTLGSAAYTVARTDRATDLAGVTHYTTVLRRMTFVHHHKYYGMDITSKVLVNVCQLKYDRGYLEQMMKIPYLHLFIRGLVERGYIVCVTAEELIGLERSCYDSAMVALGTNGHRISNILSKYNAEEETPSKDEAAVVTKDKTKAEAKLIKGTIKHSDDEDSSAPAKPALEFEPGEDPYM